MRIVLIIYLIGELIMYIMLGQKIESGELISDARELLPDDMKDMSDDKLSKMLAIAVLFWPITITYGLIKTRKKNDKTD